MWGGVSAPPAGLIQLEAATFDAADVWPIPAAAKLVNLQIWGGGGSGGNCQSGGSKASGGGGGHYWSGNVWADDLRAFGSVLVVAPGAGGAARTNAAPQASGYPGEASAVLIAEAGGVLVGHASGGEGGRGQGGAAAPATPPSAGDYAATVPVWGEVYEAPPFAPLALNLSGVCSRFASGQGAGGINNSGWGINMGANSLAGVQGQKWNSAWTFLASGSVGGAGGAGKAVALTPTGGGGGAGRIIIKAFG